MYKDIDGPNMDKEMQLTDEQRIKLREAILNHEEIGKLLETEMDY